MWQFDGRRASWHGAPPEFSIDLEHPESGLLQVRADRSGDRIGASSVLQIHLSPPPNASLTVEDAYVRGDDLIASYAATGSALAWQIYWRRAAGDPGLEVVVSLQNRLLQGNPAVCVRSRLSAQQSWCLNEEGKFVDPQAVLEGRKRPQVIAVAISSEWVYAEAIHPADVQQVQFRETAGKFETEWTLFGDNLEKGVIRRGRIWAEFFSRDTLTDALPARWKSFLESPIPLSA